MGVTARARKSLFSSISSMARLKSSPGVRNSSYQIAISRHAGLLWIRRISSCACLRSFLR